MFCNRLNGKSQFKSIKGSKPLKGNSTKHVRAVSLVFAALLAVSACCASASGAEHRPVPPEHQRWVDFDPGGGGGYRCIAFSPHEKKIVIGGDVSGVYVSDDYAHFRIRNRGLINHYVHCVLFHPTKKDIIFVGTRGGVAKSTDGGEIWQMKRNGFQSILSWARSANVRTMAIDPSDPNVLYAGLGAFGDFGSSFPAMTVLGYLYKSVDCGETWQEIQIDGGNLSDQSMMCLSIDPTNRSKLYLVSQYRFYISIDAGQTWTERSLPYADCKYTSVAAKRDDPNILLLSYAQKGADKLHTGVLRSTDNGASWTNVLSETVGRTNNGILNVRTHPSEASTFFACFHKNQKGVYRSTDAGLTWAKFNDTEEQGFSGWLAWRTKASDIAIDPKNMNVMCYIANGPGAAYLTEDGGHVWRQISCYPSPENDGTYRSSGLTILCATDLVINTNDPRQMLLGYKDQTVFKTINGGKTMFKGADPIYEPAGNIELLETDPGNSDIVYMARGLLRSTQHLHRSTDFGETVELIGRDDNGLTGHYITDIAVDPQSPIDNRTLYVSTQDSGVFKSADNGTTWSASVAGLPAESRKLTAIAVDWANRNNVYVAAQIGTGSGYVARSTDAGSTWQVVLGTDAKGESQFSTVDIRCMIVDPTDAKIIYAGNRDNQGQGVNKIFWKSTDGGATWTSVPGDVFNVGLFQRATPRKYFPQSMAADPALPGRVYFGFRGGRGDYGWDGELFYSDDYGATWALFDNTDLQHFKLWRIVVDPENTSRIYVTTAGNGIWRYGVPPPAPDTD
jgi:photosystem II stability/assembly factor-like uncharacterized protein